jgi:hypothetical protein
MATFQSRDELINAYEALLKLEEKLHQQLSGEYVDTDTVDEVLSRQSEIMSAIEEAGDLDRRVRENNEGNVRETLEEFASLREDNRETMESYTEELEKLMDSLDQAHELMKHYLQGEPRSAEEPSRRFDREV